MAATAAAAAASPSSSPFLSRRHTLCSSAFRAAAASRFRPPRCVLDVGRELLPVVQEGKRMGEGEQWTAPWTPNPLVPEPSPAGPPQEARTPKPPVPEPSPAAPPQEAQTPKPPVPKPRLTAPPQEARDSRMKIFSGTANRPLAQEIASYLGVDLGKVLIKRFADGEIYVQLQESVRGCDVFLVQPTSSPVNENLMELFIMIDACRRASARSVTVVMPYFGYARADRKAQGREAITAKLAANLLTEAGSDRVIVCDIHSTQALGYFDIPVDNIYGQPVILDYLASKTISQDLVVVSPDVGGVKRARAFAQKLSNAALAIVDKRRQGHNVSESMHLLGDVKGKVAIMVDDMIDTAGTMTSAAVLLKQEGAEAVYACSTHAVFSPPAIERLSGGVFEEVIVTNSILLPENKCFPQLTVLSIANLLAETIWHVHRDGSVSSIFL